MPTAPSFGRWLSARRHLLDLTQDELARRAGCSVVTIRKLEADERRPSKQIAARLATVLDVPATDRPAFVVFARSGSPPEAAAQPALATPLLTSHPFPRRTNLTTPLTPLIGRSQDLAAVRNLVLQGQVRLLTLIGSPGIGKTRLVIAVAGALQDAFPDGVCSVALASISDPDLVIPTIAQALGVTEIGTESVSETLKRAIADRQILLVLDNFEQVAPAAIALAELLMACLELTVLVTSRVALNVRGERLYPVPPLLLPDLAHLPGLDDLVCIPTVALFLERAQAVLPSFAISAATAAAVAEICVRLDGLPLAIELAAVRIQMFLPEALLARLGDPLKLLAGGARDMPARQQTLRATIDWSYHLLDGSEQVLFARLGVFIGGCTLEAAEAICTLNVNRPIDIVDGMMSLLDKSLLRQVEGTDGALRFTLLELIREYALERLDASGEAVLVRQQHAAYYLAMAESAEPELYDTQQLVWLARLEQEHDNLRAALEWFLVGGEADAGLRLAGALGRFWYVRGYLSEGRERLTRLLRLPAGQPSEVRMNALNATGFLASKQGDFPIAQKCFAESLAISKGCRYKQGTADAHRGLGWALLEQYDYLQSATHFDTSIALYNELGDQDGVANALFGRASVPFTQGDVAQAEAIVSKSYALFQTLSDKVGLSEVLYGLGNLMLRKGNAVPAAKMYQDSLALCRELHDTTGIALALRGLGWAAMYQRDDVCAKAYLEESRVLFHGLGNAIALAYCINSLGELARQHGDYAQAVTYYDKCLRLAQESQEKRLIAGVLHNLGHVAMHQGLYDRGEALFRESLVWVQKFGMPLSFAECLAGLGGVARVRGQLERAAQLFGATESLLKAADVVLEPADRTEYDDHLTAVRNQLDAATFAAMWAEGQAMSLEQAFAYALRETGAPSEEGGTLHGAHVPG